MLKDLNRPDGLWGEVYDRETGSKRRSNIIDRPVVALWPSVDLVEVTRIAMEEINKQLNLK